MNKTSALLALAVVVPILFVSVGQPAASQPFFYETRFAGVTPGVNDWAVMSAQENPPLGPPLDLQGIFADFSTGGEADANNTAAVLDAGYHTMVQNSFYPTGQMAVAKVSASAGGAIIDSYLPVSFNPNYINRQELPGGGYDNTVCVWKTGTASTNPVQAMDIACGIANPNNPLLTTNYFITAELYNGTGTIWLVAYALTDQWGNIAQPALVNGFDTRVSGTCLGLTTSPGRASGTPGDFTLNEVVYATFDAVSGLVVRATTFDIRTATFNVAATTYSVPRPLNQYGNTIAGIWIAQDNPLNPIQAHHVGVSIPNPNNPLGLAGTLVIFPASTGGALSTIVRNNLGGGPLSHIPWGHNPGGGRSGGPAYQMFGANGGAGGPGPTGWYVVTPNGFFGLTATLAVDTGGTALFHWAYPANAVANGTPLAHPAEISLSGVGAQRKGIVWVPYVTPGPTYALGLVEGAPWFRPTITTAFHSVGSGIAPPGNFAGQPALPKPVNTPWPALGLPRTILADQKTNFKSEYGLAIPGY